MDKMNKIEIEDAMSGLVSETILGAIIDDCEINDKKDFEFAIKCIVDELKEAIEDFEPFDEDGND